MADEKDASLLKMLEKKDEPVVEVAKDEADKRQFDALDVKGRDERYHYRWARKKDVNIARHKFNGYEVVDQGSDKVTSVLDDSSTRMKKAADTTSAVEVSDLILMRIPKEKHEQLIRARDEKIRRQTRGVAASYKRAVGQVAGPGIAYEEHRDNPSMRGMSEKAHEKYLEEQRHAQREEARRRG